MYSCLKCHRSLAADRRTDIVKCKHNAYLDAVCARDAVGKMGALSKPQTTENLKSPAYRHLEAASVNK
jgi:hypothetical protein